MKKTNFKVKKQSKKYIPPAKYSKIKNFNKLLEYFGSVKKMADFLGISTAAIYSWKKVPEKHFYKIEKVTKNKITSKDFL